MKILVVSTTVFPLPPAGYSGLEMLAYQWSVEYACAGHKVSVVAPEGSTFPEELGIELIPVPLRCGEDVAYSAYKDRLMRGDWDCCMDNSWTWFSVLAQMEADHQLPVIHCYHSDPYNLGSAPPIEKPCLVAFSEAQANIMRSRWNRAVQVCVTGDTELITSTGIAIPIADIVGKKLPIEVIGVKDGKFLPTKIKDYQKIPSFSKLLKITTAGHLLQITPDNAIMTPTGWEVPTKLKIGDYIACVKKVDERRGGVPQAELQKDKRERYCLETEPFTKVSCEEGSLDGNSLHSVVDTRGDNDIKRNVSISLMEGNKESYYSTQPNRNSKPCLRDRPNPHRLEIPELDERIPANGDRQSLSGSDYRRGGAYIVSKVQSESTNANGGDSQYKCEDYRLGDGKGADGSAPRTSDGRVQEKETLLSPNSPRIPVSSMANRTNLSLSCRQERASRHSERVYSVKRNRNEGKQEQEKAILRQGMAPKGENSEAELTFERIVSIEETDSPEFVYDLTTELGNFVANGIVIHNCHHGIDLDFYKPDPTVERGNRYLFLARYTPEKGFLEIAHLAKKCRVGLDAYGDTTIISSEDYMRRCFEESDGRQIRVMPGLSREETVKQYRSHKALLTYPNFLEIFGLTTVECMACGTPVISKDSGAARELIINGKTGFVVSTLDEFEDLINSDAVSKIKSEDCIKRAKKFSIQASAKGHLKLLEQAAQGNVW